MEHHHQSCDTIALLWLFLGDLERGHHGGHTCSFYWRLWKPVSTSMTRLPHMGPLQKVRGLSSSHSSSTRNEESDTNPHARLTYLCIDCRLHGVPGCVCTGEPRSPARTCAQTPAGSSLSQLLQNTPGQSVC